MLKSPYTSKKNVQSNLTTGQHKTPDHYKAFYEYLYSHSHLNIQLKDLNNPH